MSTTQGGGRRPATSYFRYASLVTGEMAAETASAAGSPAGGAAATGAPAEGAAAEGAAAGEAMADAAGLATALWRAAHALAPPATAAVERSVGAAGPYTASVALEATPPTGGAGQLDRRG